jgi:hypothetical protein
MANHMRARAAEEEEREQERNLGRGMRQAAMVAVAIQGNSHPHAWIVQSEAELDERMYAALHLSVPESVASV